MAAGEYVSVSSQNELIYAEVDKERLELENNAAAEQAELATMLRARGVSPPPRGRRPRRSRRIRRRRWPCTRWKNSGSTPATCRLPLVAAGASLASFAVGALIPLIPYLAAWTCSGSRSGSAARSPR
jgi:VIT1/CCC1 family predicted Fe2+/Mn2+ transporter